METERRDSDERGELDDDALSLGERGKQNKLRSKMKKIYRLGVSGSISRLSGWKKRQDKDTLLPRDLAVDYTTAAKAQFGMSNDESLKVALEQSLAEAREAGPTDESLQLALALSLSEAEAANARTEERETKDLETPPGAVPMTLSLSSAHFATSSAQSAMPASRASMPLEPAPGQVFGSLPPLSQAPTHDAFHTATSPNHDGVYTAASPYHPGAPPAADPSQQHFPASYPTMPHANSPFAKPGQDLHFQQPLHEQFSQHHQQQAQQQAQQHQVQHQHQQQPTPQAWPQTLAPAFVGGALGAAPDVPPADQGRLGAAWASPSLQHAQQSTNSPASWDPFA